MTTFKQLDELEKEVLLELVDDELISISDALRKATPLSERIRKMNEYYARSRQQSGIYRAAPVKVTPLRRAPFEVKDLPRNLPEGHPDYERQQRYYDHLWREQRRRNGYVEY